MNNYWLDEEHYSSYICDRWSYQSDHFWCALMYSNLTIIDTRQLRPVLPIWFGQTQVLLAMRSGALNLVKVTAFNE